MDEKITLEISREDLTKAIAQVLVERSQGADRLQAIESQQVSRHIRDLLADLNMKDRVWRLADEALSAAVKEKAAPALAGIQNLIDGYFLPTGPSRASRAEFAVADAVSGTVRQMLIDKRKTITKMVEDIADRLVVGPPKDGK